MFVVALACILVVIFLIGIASVFEQDPVKKADDEIFNTVEEFRNEVR